MIVVFKSAFRWRFKEYLHDDSANKKPIFPPMSVIAKRVMSIHRPSFSWANTITNTLNL